MCLIPRRDRLGVTGIGDILIAGMLYGAIDGSEDVCLWRRSVWGGTGSVRAAVELFAYPKAADDQSTSDDADGGDRFVDDEICRNHSDHGLQVHVIVGGDSAKVAYAQRP